MIFSRLEKLLMSNRICSLIRGILSLCLRFSGMNCEEESCGSLNGDGLLEDGGRLSFELLTGINAFKSDTFTFPSDPVSSSKVFISSRGILNLFASIYLKSLTSTCPFKAYFSKSFHPYLSMNCPKWSIVYFYLTLRLSFILAARPISLYFGLDYYRSFCHLLSGG